LPEIDAPPDVVNVYGAVPPVPVKVAVAFPPAQVAVVVVFVNAGMVVDAGKVMFIVALQPLLSVAVIVYVPTTPVKVFALIVPPEAVNVMPPLPPDALNVALPVPPLQAELGGVDDTTIAFGAVITTVAVAVHRLSSFTVTVYESAPRFVAIAVVFIGDVLHEYVNVPVPPKPIAVAVPLLAPLQITFVEVARTLTAELGSVNVTVNNEVQPLASVTVTV
jgi:hypothetical protein